MRGRTFRLVHLSRGVSAPGCARIALVALAAVALPAPSRAEPAEVEPARAEPSRVVETARVAYAYDRPHARRRHRVGKRARGARFRVYERAPGRGCRGDFVRIADRAWVCGRDVRPSDGPPTAAAAEGPGALPRSYVVTRDAPVFATLEDAAAGQPVATIPGVGGFVASRSAGAGGARYVKTPRGWVPADRVERVEPSRFRGVALEAGADAADTRPGFVTARGGASLYDRSGRRIRGAALPRHAFLRLGEPVRRRGRVLYRLASAGEARAAEAGDRYVRDRDVGVATFTPPPRGVGERERWIDVDRSEQVLVAYEGARPVLVTLVSTARSVPAPGIYRIEDKRAEARLRAEPGWQRQWDVHVPWMMSIGGLLALHVAYWHEDFGKPYSAGCINLSPLDARWMWEFTRPALPPGWLRVHATDHEPGTLVRVRR